MQTVQQTPDAAPAPAAPAPRKIVCLETYWGDYRVQVFQNTSVRPFLEALSPHFNPPLSIAHRFVESAAQLAHYTRFPDGLLWRDAEVFDTPFYYLSFHGSPGTLRGTLERMNAETLCAAFAGWGGQFPNLVHFGACSVFAGRDGHRFARDFLARSGCRGITGYTGVIDWIDSMVVDLLFVRRFFADPDPWTNLAGIHASVLRDFRPARRLGFVLHTPSPAPSAPADSAAASSSPADSRRQATPGAS